MLRLYFCLLFMDSGDVDESQVVLSDVTDKALESVELNLDDRG